MKISKDHAARVRKELKDAGMSPYGFMKLETSHIPSIVHENEHIKGVVYGLLEHTFDSVMLVATDKRLLFLDCKPLFKNWYSITYEVVGAVNMSIVGPFAGVVLNTKVRNYSLRFVSVACADKFVHTIERYIEEHKEPSNNGVNNAVERNDLLVEEPILEKTMLNDQKFPRKHEVVSEPLETRNSAEAMDDTAILSTVDQAGIVHASVIHFKVDKDENFYFLTKKNTKKAQDIGEHAQVALTIHHSNSLKALYVSGLASQVHDESVEQMIFSQIAIARNYVEGKHLAPITKLNVGDYVVYKITPSTIDLQDHSQPSW